MVIVDILFLSNQFYLFYSEEIISHWPCHSIIFANNLSLFEIVCSIKDFCTMFFKILFSIFLFYCFLFSIFLFSSHWCFLYVFFGMIGTGVVCANQDGIKPHVLISEYLGEIYPPYRWYVSVNLFYFMSISVTFCQFLLIFVKLYHVVLLRWHLIYTYKHR